MNFIYGFERKEVYAKNTKFFFVLFCFSPESWKNEVSIRKKYDWEEKPKFVFLIC